MAAPGTGYMRRIKPATAPLDKQPPTPAQLAVSSNLLSYLDRVAPLESQRAREHRMKVISTIRELCEAWVISTALSKRLIEHEMDAKNLAVKLYLSGSVRLGVNDEGGDIDAICVAPRGITREDFFAGMPDRLRAHRLVSEVNPLPEAGVPIIECVVGDLPVDLLFSTCQYVTMPPGGFQILDDKILANLDPASVKTLNGPRVTELTIQLVPSFPTFQVVLRAARHWARRRGIYSNKAGYLGGVNLAILSAWACQLYPAAAPAVVMTQMFRMLSEWPWPRSIMLCEPYQNAMLSQTVWDPVTDRNQRRATMPIITPAYPAANSTFNVGWSNLAVMHREFCRARDICIAAWAQVKHRGSAGARDLPADLWEPLFRPSEFFVEFDLYLAIDVWVDDGDEEAMSRWQNYVESRVREVVRCLEAERLALEFVYNWPKPVEWVRKVHEDEKALGPARVSAQRIARAEAEREAKKQAAAQEAGAEAKAQAAKPGQKRKRGAASEEEKVAADAGVGTGSPEESGPDPRADPEDGDEQKMATFFVGLALDEARLRNRSLDLRRVDGLFTRALKLKYRASLQPSMHVEERLLSWRELPAEAFGSEGRAAAAARRAALKSVELAQGGPSWRKHALPISKEAKVQSGGQGYLGSGFGGQTSLTRWVSRAEGAGAGEEAAGLHPVPRAVAAAGVLSGEVPARIRENEAVQADIANAQLPFPVTLCEAAEPASASEVAVPGIPQASRDALSQAAGGALASDKMKAGLPGLA